LRDLVAERCEVNPEAVRDVRPPFGLFTAAQLARLADWGYRTVMWTHVPPHWAQPVDQTVAELVRATTPGDLIVLHEGRPDGPPAAEIVAELVPRLRERGFEFVRVEQMSIPSPK
jgi:peptidoglycan/xylan/chitin deacetylase (PgdA/CDA1 family)